MFGNKKKKLAEQVREILLEKRDIFESGLTQLAEGEQQIHTELCDTIENSSKIIDNVMLNIEEENALLQEMDVFSRDLSDAVDGYHQLSDAVFGQLTDVINLVEENKHYTSPAKYLTETSAAMKQVCKKHEARLEKLAESSREMSVMALNAAIEAGRMGESAKSFVEISEEIRQAAGIYEQTTLSLKEEVEDSYQKIQELEDTIHRLVVLIKDGNIATTRLLKKCQQTEKMIKHSAMRDFSEDLVLMRDKVVGMRNLDEEVLKCEERNKLQMQDIQEEVLRQKNEFAELESDLSYLFDTAEKQLK